MPPPVEAPGGVAQWMKRRARREVATYRLGHDPAAPLLARSAARLLSAYERAPPRALLDVLDLDPWFVDAPLLWLCRRIIFLAAGRPRGDDDPALDVALPGSGWRGSVLLFVIWAAVIAAGLWLLQRQG